MLYIAVLVGSSLHIHGHDYDPLASPVYKTIPVEESTHHSTTAYSACYIALFAGSQSLEITGYNPAILTESIILPPFNLLGGKTSSLLGAQPLRGPPAV